MAFHLLYFHLILIYRGGSALQLVISGRKGFRVAFLSHCFLSFPFLSWHSPTFSFSLHFFGFFSNPVCFCVFFLYLIWWNFSPGYMPGDFFWLVVVWIGVSFHLICWSLSLRHPYRLFFFSFPFILIEDLCVISSIHDTLLISVASVSLGR